MNQFSNINGKKRVTSYQFLNKKYDLNFSDYNFGFDWEVYKDFIGPEYARYFTSTSFFKFSSSARSTLKTWNHLADKLFNACNFTDSSSMLIRRYANTHEDTTVGALIELCNYLYEKYGIDLGPENENGIKWSTNFKEGGDITFPSGVTLSFVGYANASKIMGKVGKGTGVRSSWTDEMVHAEEKETLTDKQLDKRYKNLRVSMFRSKSIKLSYEKFIDEKGNEQYDLDLPFPITELSWTFDEWDWNTKSYVTTTTYFYKTFSNEFSFNPFDKYHIFYKKYLTPYLPLSEKIKSMLKEKGLVWVENKSAFNNLGIFNLRLTMEAVWDRVPEFIKKLVLANKVERPDLFELEYYGFEYNDSDPSIYVLRNYRKYIKEFDINEFFNKNTKQYEFDAYAISIDYATGSEDHTVFLFFGYKLNKDNLYIPYLIEEKVVTPDDCKNLSELVEHYGQWIIDTFDKFDGFEYATFHYDINAHDFMQKLQEDIIPYLGYRIKIFKAKKHQTAMNKEAGTVNRVTWIRKLFSTGILHANLESLHYFDQCISELRFSETNTNVPDPKMYLDPYDSLFYGTYPYRFKMSI